jgi:pimeloyl-ACP methyl ester carboxylesterase
MAKGTESQLLNFMMESMVGVTPALVISAMDDPFALHKNAHALADLIPNSRLLAITDGGHMLSGHNEEVKTGDHTFPAQQCSSTE